MTAAINPNPRQFEPWEHQARAYRAILEHVKAGQRRIMVCSPVGSGKTVLSMLLARTALKQDVPVVFLADRIVLINQTSRTAYDYGLRHGVQQAKFHPSEAPDELFQICSTQTIAARKQWPAAKLVIIDEAHCVHGVWRKKLETLDPSVTVIGLSATPFTRGLGALFPTLVCPATMDELTRDGVLVPMRAKECKPIDMAGVKKGSAEWTDTDVEEPALQVVGDVVSDWLAYGENRKSIAFCTTVKHADALCRQFNDANVMAMCITHHTPDKERDDILTEFRKPDSAIRILLSVSALAKGFDVPDVACVICARPLRKSLSEFVQMLGRMLRSSPAKLDGLLLDHSGNLGRFGPDLERFYFHGIDSMDTGEKLDRTIRKEPGERESHGCPRCGSKPFAKHCMKCGYERPVIDPTAAIPGVMTDVKVNGMGVSKPTHVIWGEICGAVAKSKTCKNRHGRAWHLFNDIVGHPPPRGAHYDLTTPMPPSEAIMGKIQSMAIARSKALAKAAKAGA